MADAQHIALMHNDLLGVTAERVAGRVLRRAVIGEHHTIAIVFQPVPALLALFTAVDHTADAHQIANGVAGDPAAYGGHPADDFMARHAGIERPCPLGAGLVYIRVADAAIINGDLHIVRPRFAAGDGHRPQRLAGRVRSNSVDLHSKTSST